MAFYLAVTIGRRLLHCGTSMRMRFAFLKSNENGRAMAAVILHRMR